MTTRRDFLRAGLVTAAAIIVPDEQFVRRFFPVGIDLRQPQIKVSRKVPPGHAIGVAYPTQFSANDVVIFLNGSVAKTVTMRYGGVS